MPPLRNLVRAMSAVWTSKKMPPLPAGVCSLTSAMVKRLNSMLEISGNRWAVAASTPFSQTCRTSP